MRLFIPIPEPPVRTDKPLPARPALGQQTVRNEGEERSSCEDATDDVDLEVGDKDVGEPGGDGEASILEEGEDGGDDGVCEPEGEEGRAEEEEMGEWEEHWFRGRLAHAEFGDWMMGGMGTWLKVS